MNFNECVSRGMAFFQGKQFGPALKAFEEALEHQPGNADIRELVEMLKEQVKMTSAAAQHAANEAEHRAKAMGITDVDKAIAEYTESLKRDPNDASVKLDLASAYYIRGLTLTSKEEHAQAVEDYNKAIENNPDYPLALNKRGQANLEIGEYDQAVEDFEKLIQLNPNDAQPKITLANAYAARGRMYDQKRDYARAIPDFEKALKFNPGDNTTRELLEMAKAGKA